MATAHLIPAEERFVPVEEYLRMSFRPDCDDVDGRVEERLWSEYEHARGFEVVREPELTVGEAAIRVNVAEVFSVLDAGK